MEGVLSFVCTGAIDSALLSTLDSEFLSVASLFNHPDHRQLAERSCILSLLPFAVKLLLTLEHLHSALELKAGAFSFVGRQATTVLTRVDFTALASEDPTLWTELVSEIGEREDCEVGSKKRAREDG